MKRLALIALLAAGPAIADGQRLPGPPPVGTADVRADVWLLSDATCADVAMLGANAQRSIQDAVRLGAFLGYLDGAGLLLGRNGVFGFEVYQEACGGRPEVPFGDAFNAAMLAIAAQRN